MLENIKIKFNLSKLNKRIKRAQEQLIQTIRTDTNQYVPAKTLNLSSSTIITNKNHNLVYRTPYARYQYKGYVMTDARGRTFVGKGEKKPIITNRKLKYNKSIHPYASSQWFEQSKKAYINKWIKTVKDIIKNG